VAGAAACAVRDRDALAGDVIFFARAGERLFTGEAIQLFADARLQAGPQQIALLGALSRLAEATGLPLKLVLALVIEVGAVAACLLVLRRLVRGRTAHPKRCLRPRASRSWQSACRRRPGSTGIRPSW